MKDGRPTAFVINLDRAADRMDRARERFGALGLPVVRVTAPDARADAEAVLAERGLAIVRPPDVVGFNAFDFRAFELAEEACFQGHRRALEAFLASGERFGLILEDDAEPFGDLAGAIDGAIAAAGLWDVAKLESIRPGGSRWAARLAPAGTGALVVSAKASMGAAAYLVGRDGARRLLEASARAFEPWDYLLNDVGRHRCRLVDVSPFPIRQDGGGSLIHPDWPNHRRAKLGGPVRALRRAAHKAARRSARWRAALAAIASGARLGRYPW